MPLHPAIVHLPLALAMLIPLLALGLAVAIHRGKLPRWVWAVALGSQLLMVGAGFVGMQTGEGDEERVERVVPESAIEAHEEAAELFVWSAAGVAVLFVLGVALPKPSWRSGAMAASTVAAVAVAALALNVGRLGGELVYQHGAASTFVSSTPGTSAPVEAGGWDEDDDDD